MSLVLVMALAVVLTLLVLVFLGRTSGERRLTRALLHGEKARLVAESALREATASLASAVAATTTGWYELALAAGPDGGGARRVEVPLSEETLDLEAGDAERTLRVRARFRGWRGVKTAKTPPTVSRDERLGRVEIEAVCAIGAATRGVSAARDVRVTHADPPPPLNGFLLWIWDGPSSGCVPAAGVARLRGDGGGARRPLPAAARQAMESTTWTFDWAGGGSRYPFARERVTTFYPGAAAFSRERPASRSREIRIRGVEAVKLDGDTLTLGPATLRGPGTLIVAGGDLRVDRCRVEPAGSISLVVLGGGRRLTVEGASAALPLAANLLAPEGTIVTERTSVIEGRICAGRWSPGPGVTVHRPPSRPDYTVQISPALLTFQPRPWEIP